VILVLLVILMSRHDPIRALILMLQVLLQYWQC
jgi:hypothetical protein